MNPTLAAALPSDLTETFRQGLSYFNNPISKLVYLEKYSRWRDDLGRREVWPETVKRAVDFLRELSENKLTERDYAEIEEYILHLHALPSMRLLNMAGPAARRQNVSVYNCAYTAVDSIEAFVEALVISMAGTGFGYSVEKKYVEKLPFVKKPYPHQPFSFVVEDSAEGWADALRIGISAWFEGYDVEFDLSKIRLAGSILRTKGGRASGPEPLQKMLEFARETIRGAAGRKLRPIECHDIMGNIALGAVSGGHRRSAMISLYSWDDQEMRHCKDGEFWNETPWRTTANNSAVIDDPDLPDESLREHFRAMVAGGNGEPGIFSRVAARTMLPRGREDGDFGTNPCAEIILRSRQFCNLSEVICTKNDTSFGLAQKTRIATIIGTIQSMATHFPGLSPMWRENAEKERLLGVGFTGQMDCPAIQDAEVMQVLRNVARTTNEEYAKILGINVSASITCVKPSGSTSLLADTASGLHTRWAPYYERNIRVMATGPVAQALLFNQAPMHPENGQEWGTADTYVVHFPMSSPEGAPTRGDRSAIEQCEYWKLVKLNLTDHNPSVTITYRPDEVGELEDWVVAHRDILGGMAFLPHFDEDIGLKQMPNREITKAEYDQMVEEFPEIDYAWVTYFEKQDQTTASSERACSAGLCDVEDVPLERVEEVA